jgi:hypothetical protein
VGLLALGKQLNSLYVAEHYPQWGSAIATQVATEPQYVCGAATRASHLFTEITSGHEIGCRLRRDLYSGNK